MIGSNVIIRLVVGVIVERRKAKSPWIDYTWAAVEVLDGEPAAEPWTVLSDDGERATFYAGTATLDLYRTETGNYRDNLASGAASVWVALTETGGHPPYAIAAATVDPAEGEALTQPGSLVEAVPMPETIRHTLAEFVARHHVETAFVKRKRDRADPEALARRLPVGGKTDD